MNEEESKATCTLCKKRQSKITEEGLCDTCVSKADTMSSLNDDVKVEEDTIQEVANDMVSQQMMMRKMK